MSGGRVSLFWIFARRWQQDLIFSLTAIFAILYFVDIRRLVEAIRLANYWFLLAVLAISLVWLSVREII